jgi:hypothetical protein
MYAQRISLSVNLRLLVFFTVHSLSTVVVSKYAHSHSVAGAGRGGTVMSEGDREQGFCTVVTSGTPPAAHPLCGTRHSRGTPCGHWRDKMASHLFVEVRITDYSISYRFVRLYGVSKTFSLFKVMRCVILSISVTIRCYIINIGDDNRIVTDIDDIVSSSF